MNENFPYPLRSRLSAFPTFAFLCFLFVVLLVAPEELWGESPDSGSHRAALIVVGVMVLVTGAVSVRRLSEPVEITLTTDGVHARRMMGEPRIVAYGSIERIVEYPTNFLRPLLELEIRGGGARVAVNNRIADYERLRDLVVQRASPLAQVTLADMKGKRR